MKITKYLNWSWSFTTRPLVVAAILVSCTGAASPPDWTGVWVIPDSFLDKQDGKTVSAPGRDGLDSPGLRGLSLGSMPKIKPEFRARVQEFMAADAKGEPIGDGQCGPGAMPGFWNGPYSWEIVTTPKQVMVFQEFLGQLRRVYLDGRKHPSLDDVEPLYLGHSVGHWEGTTLVVDTVNFHPTTAALMALINHTSKSHIVERFEQVAPDRIDVKVTFTNPDLLEEPWTFVRKLKRKPGMEILDYFCGENNRDRADERGVTTPKLHGE